MRKILRSKFLVVLLLGIFLVAGNAFAQANSQRLNDLIDRMQKKLQLTQEQIDQIKPIVREEIVQYEKIMEEVSNEQMNHKTARSFLANLRKDTNDKLAKYLTSQQMKTWMDYQELMKRFNGNVSFDRSDVSSINLGEMGVQGKF